MPDIESPHRAQELVDYAADQGVVASWSMTDDIYAVVELGNGGAYGPSRNWMESDADAKGNAPCGKCTRCEDSHSKRCLSCKCIKCTNFLSMA
jgi:hypothetical protein